MIPNMLLFRKDNEYNIELFVVNDFGDDYSNDITSNKVEDGSNISDNISHNPISLTLDLFVQSELVKESLIVASQESKVPLFDLFDSKHNKLYENFMIESLSFKDNDKHNGTFDGSLKLKQVVIGKQPEKQEGNETTSTTKASNNTRNTQATNVTFEENVNKNVGNQRPEVVI